MLCTSCCHGRAVGLVVGEAIVDLGVSSSFHLRSGAGWEALRGYSVSRWDGGTKAYHVSGFPAEFLRELKRRVAASK